MPARHEGRVTKQQIEAKLGDIQHEVDKGAESAKTNVVRSGVVLVLVVIVIAYLLGRRRGGRRSTVVEIRRV